jgi:hypothetical protein
MSEVIPEQRLKYFTDPDYRTGRLKGSRRDFFHRNGNTDDEMVRDFDFLKHARYFVYGPDLPSAAMTEFREAVRRCGLKELRASLEPSASQRAKQAPCPFRVQKQSSAAIKCDFRPTPISGHLRTSCFKLAM